MKAQSNFKTQQHSFLQPAYLKIFIPHFGRRARNGRILHHHAGNFGNIGAGAFIATIDSFNAIGDGGIPDQFRTFRARLTDGVSLHRCCESCQLAQSSN